MTAALKLLMVEDSAADAELLIREIRKGGLDILPFRVDSREALENALDDFGPDVILCDYTLPRFSGMEALYAVRLRRLHTPLIFVSGTIGEERAIEALKQGATDYVLKHNRGRLVPAIRRALEKTEERRARSAAERQLRASELRFRLFMEHLPGPAFIKDLAGRFTYVNAALERIVGRTAAEVVGHTVEEFFSPQFAGDYTANDKTAISTGTVIQAIEQVPMSDGTHFFLTHKFPIRDPDGQPALLGGIKLDMTERIRAEHALRDSEERFRSIAEVTQEWIWELDARGNYTFCSAAVGPILGYAPHEILGKNPLDFMHEQDQPAALDLWQSAVAEKRGWKDLIRPWRHKNGGIRRLESSARPLLDEAGDLVAYHGADRDVTGRIQQQEKIVRLSRMHAMRSGINAAIIRVRERQQLFEEACRIVVEHGQFKMAWMGLAQSVGTKPTPVAWRGFEDGFLEEFGAALRNRIDDPSAVGRALRDKEIVVSNDIANDPHMVFKEHALARGYRSMVALPLLVAGAAIGVLVLYAAESDVFDREELNLLKEMAADLSFALDFIAKEEKLAYVSHYDALTGLANRQLFLDRVAQSVEAAGAERRPFAVLIIDLQRFRHVNETLGRAAGDSFLNQFSARLTQTFSGAANLARIGGDRFAVTHADLSGGDVNLLIEQWIRLLLAEPFMVEGFELRTAVKMGVSFFPQDGSGAESLFRHAEAALRQAKETPDTCVFYAPEMNARVADKLHFESRLHRAVREHQFLLHYQPMVDMQTGVIRGLEGLLRWQDPTDGLVSPLLFIPLLEETGMIVEVGRWAIETVSADLRSWRQAGLRPPRVAVNVSQVQLNQKDFVATVLAARGDDQDDAIGLDLEITESLVMTDMAANFRKLEAMRASGIRVAMDDFGTGFSSLSQIARLPLDALKIDRAFISNMLATAADLAIVSTIISLAHGLDILVVAEGVETQEQAERLQLLACDLAQGYFYSRPVPAAEIAKMLALAH